MKKHFFIPLILILVLLSFSGIALAENISIVVNGNNLESDTQPLLQDGTTYVPLRVISEALNAEVGWSNADSTAIVRKDYETSLPINTPEHMIENLSLEINGEVIEIELIMTNGRILVPLRIISEHLGAEVLWDGTAKTVSISFDEVDEYAVDILMETEKNMLEIPAYSFKMTGTISMTYALNEDVEIPEGGEDELAAIDGMEMDMAIEAEGFYRNPMEIYIKMKIDLGSALEAMSEELGEEVPPVEDMVLEMYLKDNMAYMKMGTDEWISSEVPIDLSQFSPETYVDLMGTLINSASYLELAEIDDKTYHVIEYALDSKGFMEMMDEVMATFGMSEIVDPEIAEFDFDMSEMIKDLDARYLYYIDSEDLTLHKVNTEMFMKMEIMALIMEMNADIAMQYDYENIGEMPVLD